MTTLRDQFVIDAEERAEVLACELGLRGFDLELIKQALVDAYDAGRTDGYAAR